MCFTKKKLHRHKKRERVRKCCSESKGKDMVEEVEKEAVDEIKG